MFSITYDLIRSDLFAAELKNDSTVGALVTFEGIVRNHNDGKKVKLLEYECYEEMTLNEGEKILANAINHYSIQKCLAVHRIGRLDIGEMAVWVGVTAHHRKAAFEACEYIIDEIKAQLPIWKKEHYLDGNSVWVFCKQCSLAHHDRHAHDQCQTSHLEIANK